MEEKSRMIGKKHHVREGKEHKRQMRRFVYTHRNSFFLMFHIFFFFAKNAAHFSDEFQNRQLFSVMLIFSLKCYFLSLHFNKIKLSTLHLFTVDALISIFCTFQAMLVAVLFYLL